MHVIRRTTIVILITLFFSITTTASADTKLTVLLDWFINPDHAPLIVALEKGFFKAQGLDVTLEAPANPNDPPKLVAAGKADLAVSYQPQHHLHVDQGLPLVRIATIVATPLNSLVVLDDGDIKSIADLKGKTIGYSVGGFETILLEVMLEKVGLALADVTLVNVNFSLSPSLFAGKTDAVVGAFRNFELNQMDIEGRPGKAFYVEEYGVPAYDELILVANKERINDENLRKFVNALEAGVQYLLNHPEESWELFIKGDRAELNDELNKRAWADTLPRFALRPGALDKNRYDTFARFLVEQKMIESVPDLDSWAVELP